MLRVALLSIALSFTAAAPAMAQGDCAGPIPYRCNLMKGWVAVFAGTAIKIDSEARFRVDERFKGAEGEYFDVEELPLGRADFIVGKQYLVFAAAAHLSDGEHLYAPACSPTQELEYAKALVEQLRAEKKGRRNSSVYGMLMRSLEPYIGIWDESYIQALPGVTIILRSRNRTFTAVTDEAGAYQFEHLPGGKYAVSATGLPPNLEIAQQILDDPVSFELPGGMCYDNELTALPTGQISGQVIGPDGVPLRSTSVELYRVDQYKEGQNGKDAYQGDGKPFRIKHLRAGDYLLVFNSGSPENPDAPFAETFYPHAVQVQEASVIHLKDGEQLTNMDIHVGPQAWPTRKITVRLDWNGRNPMDYSHPFINTRANKGLDPYAFRAAQGTYSLNVFLDATYTLQAEAFCRRGIAEQLKSNSVTLRGGDTATSSVVLTFQEGGCTKK